MVMMVMVVMMMILMNRRKMTLLVRVDERKRVTTYCMRTSAGESNFDVERHKEYCEAFFFVRFALSLG